MSTTLRESSLRSFNNSTLIGWGDSLTAGDMAGMGGVTGSWMFNVGVSYSPARLSLNRGVDAQTSSQILTRFQADIDHRNCVNFIWVGRNDFFSGTYTDDTTILANIASMVGAVEAENGRFLVFTILNKNTEIVGTTTYNLIKAANADIMSTYPNNYIDVRGLFVAAGQVSDPTDFANDCMPTSQTIDGLHPTATLQAVLTSAAVTKLANLGW